MADRNDSMTKPVDYAPASQTERAAQADRLSRVQGYGKPRKVWVDDGHVFVEGYDGTVVSMTPEVALELSRLIGEAGAESLINQGIDQAADRSAAMRSSPAAHP